MRRGLLFLFFLLCLGVVSLVFLDDPYSRKFRAITEGAVNLYAAGLENRASSNRLSLVDRAVLHTSAFSGIIVSKYHYPEASKLLFHYLYGGGDELELSAEYFSKSVYLRSVIDSLGEGEHGPIGLRQSDDWRLSLALNPYYLNVGEDKVRLYHPRIEFEPVDGKGSVVTNVPLGRLMFKVPDRLVSALKPTPFYVFSEWKRL